MSLLCQTCVYGCKREITIMLLQNGVKRCFGGKKVLRWYCKSAKSGKYKDTVLLPKTKFPQRLSGKKLIEQSKNVYEVSFGGCLVGFWV